MGEQAKGSDLFGGRFNASGRGSFGNGCHEGTDGDEAIQFTQAM
ncbi:hypothetical protein CEV33_4378 [Brucella grignonensis]|uniref:Uncharacterized protein n=1 Tax=Brucella grignonensis TaxID=94627 RepID=A0A256FNF9_9HYPH|nr:hypothetical protein CEV33_4378 [Brucella grignonensis]